MSYADDINTPDSYFYQTYPTARKRKACHNCGNSLSFYLLAVADHRWWFECRRCGMTTPFTDGDVRSWENDATVGG